MGSQILDLAAGQQNRTCSPIKKPPIQWLLTLDPESNRFTQSFPTADEFTPKVSGVHTCGVHVKVTQEFTGNNKRQRWTLCCRRDLVLRDDLSWVTDSWLSGSSSAFLSVDRVTVVTASTL